MSKWIFRGAHAGATWEQLCESCLVFCCSSSLCELFYIQEFVWIILIMQSVYVWVLAVLWTLFSRMAWGLSGDVLSHRLIYSRELLLDISSLAASNPIPPIPHFLRSSSTNALPGGMLPKNRRRKRGRTGRRGRRGRRGGVQRRRAFFWCRSTNPSAENKCAQKKLWHVGQRKALPPYPVFYSSCSDLNELTSTVSSYISFCVESNIPCKDITVFPNNKPWVTKELKSVINRKKRIFYTGNSQDKKEMNRELRNEIKKAKTAYREKVELKYSSGDLLEGNPIDVLHLPA